MALRPNDRRLGKSFIGARQSAFQHELAHGAMRYRRRCLQDALRVAGESQVELLRTGGVRWHDITFILSLACMPDNVKTMVSLAMGRQPLAGIKNKIGKSWLLPGFPPSLSAPRIQSVDALRGAIMMLMAIDHIRDYVARSAQQFLPTDLTRTTPAIFFTRWITHFCAPVFMLTAGLGAYFWMTRGHHSKGELSRLLISRGIWLIVLEVTILRLIFFSQISFTANPVILIILWAIGISMIALGRADLSSDARACGHQHRDHCTAQSARPCLGRALRAGGVDLGHSVSARCFRLRRHQLRARISGAALDRRDGWWLLPGYGV